MNKPAVCCAWVDDFDWVLPNYVPEILLSGRDIDVGLTDRTCFRSCLTGRLLC